LGGGMELSPIEISDFLKEYKNVLVNEKQMVFNFSEKMRFEAGYDYPLFCFKITSKTQANKWTRKNSLIMNRMMNKRMGEILESASNNWKNRTL
jgi:predicted chitinase